MGLSQGRRLQTQGRNVHQARTEGSYCTGVGAKNPRKKCLRLVCQADGGHIEHNSY